MIKFNHLLGRPFEYGRTDCWALARDFYNENFDLALPNFAGPIDWWKVKGWNMMHDLILKAGFEVVYDFNLKNFAVGDMLGISLKTEFVSHIGVYVGDGKILHHPPQRLSTVEPIRGAVLNLLTSGYRHPKVRVDQVVTQVDALTLVPPTVRKKLEALREQL